MSHSDLAGGEQTVAHAPHQPVSSVIQVLDDFPSQFMVLLIHSSIPFLHHSKGMGCPCGRRFHTPPSSPLFCRFRDVHFLPITQQEGLALTPWQIFQCFFNKTKQL